MATTASPTLSPTFPLSEPAEAFSDAEQIEQLLQETLDAAPPLSPAERRDLGALIQNPLPRPLMGS